MGKIFSRYLPQRKSCLVADINIGEGRAPGIACLLKKAAIADGSSPRFISPQPGEMRIFRLKLFQTNLTHLLPPESKMFEREFPRYAELRKGSQAVISNEFVRWIRPPPVIHVVIIDILFGREKIKMRRVIQYIMLGKKDVVSLACLKGCYDLMYHAYVIGRAGIYDITAKMNGRKRYAHNR